ncbi:C39 family peptidase [Campylobacter coli]
MEKILKILLFLPILTLSAKAEWVVKSYQEIKNERVIRQAYEQSCGASSLATLLNILDDQKKFDELELLKIMSGQELYTDMVSFADLNDAVKKLGFQSNSYQINRENLDKLVNIPMLVKIEDDPRFPHFVVIINHKGNYLQVLDPSHGEYISSKNHVRGILKRTCNYP